jgi:DNA-binding NtrC family response regulator
MPTFGERPDDRVAIARSLLPALASRMGMQAMDLDAGVVAAIQQRDWPGNLRQMRAVLSALLVNHRNGRPMTKSEFDKTYARLARKPVTSSDLRSLLDGALAEGRFSFAGLEREAYAAAVARTDGNLSAAARLLGLSRAQLAYRLGRDQTADVDGLTPPA